MYELALSVSARVGLSDNPRRLLDALADEIFEHRAYRVSDEHVFFMLPRISSPGEFSAPALGLLVLSVAELVRPGIELHYVQLPAAGVVRYRQGDYVVNLLVADGSEGEFTTGESLKERFQISDEQERHGVYLRELELDRLGGLLLHELGEGAQRLGRPELAVGLFTDAAGKRATSASALALAHIAFQNRDLDQALTYTKEALAYEPGNFSALEMRARLLRSTGKTGVARDLYRQLIQDFPASAGRLCVAAAELETEARNWQEAVRNYREAAFLEGQAEDRQRLLALADELEVYPDLEKVRGAVDETSEADYAAKFAALRRIAHRPTPEAYAALVDALDDSNRRFARMAWKTLGEMSGQDLPFERDAWRAWLTDSGTVSDRR